MAVFRCDSGFVLRLSIARRTPCSVGHLFKQLLAWSEDRPSFSLPARVSLKNTNDTGIDPTYVRDDKTIVTKCAKSMGVEMSGMVFCRGCGAEIHSTAPACPKCGAPQQLVHATRLKYSFGGVIALCFNRYVQFSGRAPRAEYWYFVLFTTLVDVGAGVVDAISGAPVLAAVANLVFLLPTLSVWVRRLHDCDRSGWWCWLVLVPLVGWVILLVWSLNEGTRGSNRFGPDPLEA